MRTATALLKGWLSPNRYGLIGNGTDKRVTLPVDTKFDLTTFFSIECWIMPDDNTTNIGMFSKNDAGGATNKQWLLYGREAIDPAKFRFRVVKGGLFTTLVGNTSYLGGRLYHLVATYDNANLRLYVNGVQDATPAVLAGPLDSFPTGAVLYGALANGSYHIKGLIAGGRIYKRTLSDAEVLQHYQGIFNDERGLVWWAPGVDATGTTLLDASGNALNGTLVNSPTRQFFDPYPESMQRLVVADLYTFALKNGTFLRYTSFDADVVFGGNTFLSNAPIVQRDRVRSNVGISVDAMRISVNPRTGDLIGSVPWIQAARMGALDGARVTLQRAYVWNPYVPPIGVLTIFAGNVAGLEGGRSGVSMDVKSDLEMLNVQMPRNLVQPPCLHTLFDAGCTLVKASFAVASSVNAGSTTTTINCGLAQSAGHFDQGTITFTSGVNNGVSRNVKSYTPGVLKLSLPLVSVPGVGDTFNAFPGCDKTQATCTTKFSNLPNFKAMPYVPIPETAV